MRTMDNVGERLVVNGQPVEPKAFFGAEGFMFCQWAMTWIRGSRLPNGTKIDAWGVMHRILEEDVLDLGCKWFRAPIENEGWGPPYFNHPEFPNHQGLVDVRTGIGSSDLPEQTKKIIRLYVILARKFDLIFQIPIVWTLKDTLGPDDPRYRITNRRGEELGERGIGVWNEHFVADVLRYATKLKKHGDGEGNNRVDPGNLNLYFSIANEWRTVRGGSEPWTKDQVLLILARAKERQGHPEFGDWPDELLSISSMLPGDDIRFDVPGEVSHAEPHPQRHGTWTQQGRDLRNAWPRQLIIADESMMLWTKQDLDAWVEKIPKWRGLGTTDVDAWQRMHADFWKHGIYSQAHTFPHMSVRWHGSTNSGEVVKAAIRELTGATPGGPPPPPPPDNSGDPRKGELELHVLGENTGTPVWPERIWPLLIQGGTEKDAKVTLKSPGAEAHSSAIGEDRGVLRCEYTVRFPRQVKLWRIETFIASDAGDVFEAHLNVFGFDARRIYHRSEHKEEPFGHYDAYKHTDFPVRQQVSGVYISVLYRVNGQTQNELRKRKENYEKLGLSDRYSGVGHFNVFFYWE